MTSTKKYKKHMKKNTKKYKRKTRSKKIRAGNPPDTDIHDLHDMFNDSDLELLPTSSKSVFKTPPNSPYNTPQNLSPHTPGLKELLETPEKVTLTDTEVQNVNELLNRHRNDIFSIKSHKPVKPRRNSKIYKENYIKEKLLNKIYNNKGVNVPLASLKHMPYLVEMHEGHGDINKSQEDYNNWRKQESEDRKKLRTLKKNSTMKVKSRR